MVHLLAGQVLRWVFLCRCVAEKAGRRRAGAVWSWSQKGALDTAILYAVAASGHRISVDKESACLGIEMAIHGSLFHQIPLPKSYAHSKLISFLSSIKNQPCLYKAPLNPSNSLLACLPKLSRSSFLCSSKQLH